MIFNEYCALGVVVEVHFVNTLEKSIQHYYHDPNMEILFVGTKKEGDMFKGMLVVLGYNPTKVKRFDDVHSMFNSCIAYNMGTLFFSTQEHIEKSGIPYHTRIKPV